MLFRILIAPAMVSQGRGGHGSVSMKTKLNQTELFAKFKKTESNRAVCISNQIVLNWTKSCRTELLLLVSLKKYKKTKQNQILELLKPNQNFSNQTERF